MRTRPVVCLLVVVGPLVSSACDDVTPLPYRTMPRDAEVPDHVDLDRAVACRSCATAVGATCRPALDRCEVAHPRCGDLLECLTETDCWRKLNFQNFADPPPCAVDCLSRTEVTSVNEIGVPATEFYLCVIDPARCAPACIESTAPAPGDE